MLSRFRFVIVTLFLVVTSVLLFYVNKDFKDSYYDRLDLINPPLKVSRESDQLRTVRLEIAGEKWVVLDAVESDSLLQLFQEMGWESGVRGFEKFYSYKVPSYCWFKPLENIRNYRLSEFILRVRPVAIDQTYHADRNRDFGLIFVSKDRAIYHQNLTDGTVVEGLLIREGAQKNKYEELIDKGIPLPVF